MTRTRKQFCGCCVLGHRLPFLQQLDHKGASKPVPEAFVGLERKENTFSAAQIFFLFFQAQALLVVPPPLLRVLGKFDVLLRLLRRGTAPQG